VIGIRGAQAALFRIADSSDPSSRAARARRNRVRTFVSLFAHGRGPLQILDIGGTSQFWRSHVDLLPAGVSITVLNTRFDDPAPLPWIRQIAGDAREMTMFGDREFDVCFSNSVIEHVGEFDDQRRMANEIRRVARGYFVQTPNLYFPLEPHFLAPGWQFLPIALRVRLLRRFDLGWMPRTPDLIQARAAVESIRLLGARHLQQLFPGCRLYREKIGFLTKSLIAWHTETC